MGKIESGRGFGGGGVLRCGAVVLSCSVDWKYSEGGRNPTWAVCRRIKISRTSANSCDRWRFFSMPVGTSDCDGMSRWSAEAA